MNLTSYILVVLILVFTLVLTHEANGLDNCPLTVKAHGCFEDKPRSRVLKDLILYRRGAINWTSYDTFLERFVCDCAKVAEKKGYKVFGIQFYAECWGNRTFTKESLPQEKPVGCLSGDLTTKCPSTGPDRVCTGKMWRNFVFSLEKPNACTSKPCKNGGSCEVSGQDSFTCKCSKGFHGKNCDKVDACDSQPCHNGASCKITGNNTYQCQCAVRYFGSNCENANACMSQPCQNGATCKITGDNTYKCQCMDGFFGTFCGKVDACSRLPCKNGATCSRTGTNTYSCKCIMGYSGQNCSEVNLCIISPPCQNGGTCTSTGNSSYTCRCPERFYGFNCEKMDACSRLPCKNAATCSRTGNNTYSCKCIMGYFGQNCSEVNRCIISPPCQNGGSCTSTGNSSYTCRCPDGFYGFNCEKMDACSRRPCKNGATCSRTGNNTYSCKCIMGYSGQNCSEVNRCIISPSCQNGGNCTSTGNSSYLCRCREGFYGFNCEKMDACSRLPCENGATCSRTGNNTYSCKCIMGYSGQNCSEVNRCIISPPCQNGGTCTSTGNSSYMCRCPEGFYGFNCEKNCSHPMDIALAIDSSGSVGRRSFQLVKAFLKVLTHHFEVTNTTHFSCLHYDHRVFKDFEFKDTQYHNHSSLDAKIQSMLYLGGATLTDHALMVAKTFFFRRNGARNKRKVKRALVVLTDGKSYYGVPSLVHPTYVLKENMSVRIVAIGVGPYVSLQELQVMADGLYVLVENFNALAKAITDVMDLVCK